MVGLQHLPGRVWWLTISLYLFPIHYLFLFIFLCVSVQFLSTLLRFVSHYWTFYKLSWLTRRSTLYQAILLEVSVYLLTFGNHDRTFYQANFLHDLTVSAL